MHKIDEIDKDLDKKATVAEIAKTYMKQIKEITTQIELDNAKNEDIQELIDNLCETDKMIYQLRKSGLNQSQIANKMGYTKQEISRRVIKMKNSGIEFDTQTYIRKIQKENVYKLIQKGLSPQEIAKVLNIDEYKVKAHIKNLRDSGLEIHIDRKKVKRKKVKYQVDEIDKQIIELRKQGHTLDEIAELLGRAKITIAKRIQKMKVNNIEVPDATRRDYYEKIVRNNEMAKLYEDGMNSIDIAKEYGVSKSLVWNVVHEKGIKRQSKHKHSEETLKQIVDLYKKGFGIKELGMIFTISHGTISKILTENGVKAVWDRKIKKVVREKIVKLSEQGLSIEEIARKVGCSQVMVGRVLKRNEKTKCKYYLENVGKEKLINAILKLRKSKNATDEQLAVIAEKYGVDIKDVLAVAKDREER